MPEPQAAPAGTRSLGGVEELQRLNMPALLAVLLGVFLGTLDIAIANTALPVIAASLGCDESSSIWIINAFQLAVVATLLPFAALADAVGPRKIFIFGLAFFTAASLGCVLADTLAGLAVFRALQGIGAGAIMSVNIALIRLIYPSHRLGRGVGLNALVVGVGFAIGPTVASLVLSLASWPWLFGVNVPLGALAVLFALQHLPGRDASGQPFDKAAAALAALAFGALVFALIEIGQQARWPVVLGAGALFLLAGAVLLARQRGHATPIFPLDLLRRPMFALSALTAFAAFAAQGLAFVSLPFFFQSQLHRSVVETGFLMTAWPVLVALAAPLAGRLSDRHHPGLLGGVGLGVLCAGTLLLARLAADASVWQISACMGLCGAGFGFFQSPNLRALMTSAPAHRSGGASGMIGMVRLIGQTSGAALVALCFGVQGLAGAMLALYLAALFALLGATASFSRLRAPLV